VEEFSDHKAVTEADVLEAFDRGEEVRTRVFKWG
jgi:hypothetical protein